MDDELDNAAIEIRAAVSRTIGELSPAEAIVTDLLTRHAESHRHYHTAEHVMWVLRHVARLGAEADRTALDRGGVDSAALDRGAVDRGAVEVAALFHDAVYDPHSTTNEIDSATLAAEHLRRSGWDSERIGLVERLIVATAGHDAHDANEALLLDADLAILGSSSDDYAQYVRRVRAEYAFVDDDRWRAGRAAVLDGFLARERIYATPMMWREREQRARRNLTTERAGLRLPLV